MGQCILSRPSGFVPDEVFHYLKILVGPTFRQGQEQVLVENETSSFELLVGRGRLQWPLGVSLRGLTLQPILRPRHGPGVYAYPELGPETTVTGESRITQVFRCGDIYIRIPIHSATTSLTFGTLSSNEPWCIITSDNKASTASDNDSDSGRLTETNIRRAPSRSALRIQATACPAGNSPKDLRQCVNPRARPN